MQQIIPHDFEPETNEETAKTSEEQAKILHKELKSLREEKRRATRLHCRRVSGSDIQSIDIRLARQDGTQD